MTAQILEQNAYRTTIANNMVQGYKQCVLVVAQLRHTRAEKRPLRKIKRLARLFFQQPSDRVIASLGTKGGQIDIGNFEGHAAMNVMKLPAGAKGGAEGFMPLHQPFKGLFQSQKIQLSA